MTTTLIQNKPLYEGMKVTREEYLDLEDDGFKYDMADGVLYMSPSAFSEHNRSLARIITAFVNFLDSDKKGQVLPETDIFLPDDGDVLRPDITVVLKENYGIIKGHIHGIPDIVVEVLSEATRKRDLGDKADRYLSNGVREYWIADPDEKTIALWINVDNGSRTAGEPQATHSTSSVQASSPTKSWNKKNGNVLESSILSGFVLKQEDVFPKQ
jgi:Uma2 family endonuclease